MINGRELLDAMVNANATRHAPGAPDNAPRSFLQDALEAFGGSRTGAGGILGQVLGQATGGLADMARHPNAREAMGGQSVEDLARRAQEMMGRNPGIAKAAVVGAAGLLLGTRGGRGIAGNLAKLGGLALIGGLAYRAFRNYQSGEPLLGQGRLESPELAPGAPHLDPSAATDEDAMLFVRAMTAAVTADGHMDEGERERVTTGVTRAGLDREGVSWLANELANPASVEELARSATSLEKSAQVYAAARLAIEPDTPQEREFLHSLAEALKLDPALKREIDEGASGVKVPADTGPGTSA
jgi:uncharacterized membrane protein YebE (DUF533 family)